MADANTDPYYQLGNLLSGLIQRGTGQYQARKRHQEREKLLKQGLSPADIFESEESRRDQALAGANVLGGIGEKLPVLKDIPLAGGLFEAGESLPAPGRTQEELLRASQERRAEEQSVRAEETAGRAKALHPLKMKKIEAEIAKLGDKTSIEDKYKLSVGVQTELAAAQDAGEEITVKEALDRVQKAAERRAIAGRRTPEQEAAVDQKTVARAELRSAMQELRDARKEARKLKGQPGQAAANQAVDELKAKVAELRTASLGGSVAKPLAAPQAAPAPVAEKVVVEKDGKRFRLPARQLEEAQRQGYKLVQE